MSFDLSPDTAIDIDTAEELLHDIFNVMRDTEGFGRVVTMLSRIRGSVAADRYTVADLMADISAYVAGWESSPRAFVTERSRGVLGL